MDFYIAVFMPVKEGGYAIEFPDIPEAFSQGKDLSECMTMAADVLRIAVEEYAKARRELPKPSDMEAVKVWAAAQKEDENLSQDGEFVYQLFAAPDMDWTPVRISVSLAKGVLTTVDEKAKLFGLTRSGLLAAAALAYSPRGEGGRQVAGR